MDETAGRARSRVGLNLTLCTLALLLACGVAFGGVVVRQDHRDRDRDAGEQERYSDVLAAAEQEAEAFLNIGYRDAQEGMDAIAAGATGDLRRQYARSTNGVVEVLRRNRSVRTGKVVWAGVVDVDADSATVLAATSGTLANVSTGNRPVGQKLRIRLDLLRRHGRWLTSDLELVG